MKMFLSRFLPVLFFVSTVSTLEVGNSQQRPRQLDPISGGDVLRRYTGKMPLNFTGENSIKSLLTAQALNKIGGSELLNLLNSMNSESTLKTSDAPNRKMFYKILNNFRSNDYVRPFDRSPRSFQGYMADVGSPNSLWALDRPASGWKALVPKRNLDTLSGMAFGENKRMDSLSGAAFGNSKRNFDEIDNVGFNGFAKKKDPKTKTKQNFRDFIAEKRSAENEEESLKEWMRGDWRNLLNDYNEAF